jgi:hypothetical protein
MSRAAAFITAVVIGAASAPASAVDLSGVWLAFGSDARGRTSAAPPEYSERGTQRLDDFYARYREIPEPGAYCVPGGMPSIMLNLATYPVEILQTPGRITMLAELEMQVRRIWLDGRSHPGDFPPTGIGHSIGHWDGDTLVVDTALLEPWPLKPWPRSEQMHIVERIHLAERADVDVAPTAFITEEPISDDVLVDEVTVTDPQYYAGPQTRTMYYMKVRDTATLEYDCVIDLWRQALDAQRIRK